MREPHHRRLSVAEVIVETDDARSFVLDVPPEDADRFRYRPGQFLTVRVPCVDGGFVARCYSLSSAPGDGRLTITVKRMPAGQGSNWLCDNVTVGTELDVLPPAGTFTPRSLDADLLLFAGGSGITPVMSILRSALATGSGEIVLVYANRDAGSIIFGDELSRLEADHSGRLTVVHWLQSASGLPTAQALRDLAAPHADHEAFVCGPEPFMAAVDTALRELGVPRGRVHVERFVSLPGDPFVVPDVLERAVNGSRDIGGVRVTEPSAGPADAARNGGLTTGLNGGLSGGPSRSATGAVANPDPGGAGTATATTSSTAGTTATAALERGTATVEGVGGTEPGPPTGVVEVDLDGTTRQIPWPEGVRLLDVLVDHGLSAPFSCRQGLCGACTCRVEEGEVAMVNNEVLEPEDLADGYVLACQALRRSQTVRISYT